MRHVFKKSKIEESLKGILKSDMPKRIKPMLAVPSSKPFDRKGWIFEIKWDGYRAITYVNDKTARLFSRNYQSLNKTFPEIVRELDFDADVILDGEIVILDNKGRSRFQLIQNYQRTKKGNLYYYVFDMLYLNGHDLRQLPLIVRKEILKKFLFFNKKTCIRFSSHIKEHGIALFSQAKKNKLEGIIGKDEQSPYLMTRSPYWEKIKVRHGQEVVIGGFTQPKGSREKFGALLVGVYNKNSFVYIGRVGGGFTRRLINEVYQKLTSLIIVKCPFQESPELNIPMTWVKPKLVCEVSFTEWTSDGSLRHPIFKGLRMDKQAKNVIREACS